MAITTKYGRILAFALLVPVLLLALVIAAGPHLWANHQVNKLEKNNMARHLMQGKLPQITKLREDRLRLLSLGSRKNLLLDGETTGVIQAGLQSRVTELITQNAGQIKSISLQQPKRDEGLTSYTISLAFKTSLKGLRDMLFQLETGQPLLFIDTLLVQPVSSIGRVGRDLSVDLRVKGFAIDQNKERDKEAQ